MKLTKVEILNGGYTDEDGNEYYYLNNNLISMKKTNGDHFIYCCDKVIDVKKQEEESKLLNLKIANFFKTTWKVIKYFTLTCLTCFVLLVIYSMITK